MDEPTAYCLDRLRARGFEKSQVSYVLKERDELQAELGRPSLFRTVADTTLTLTGMVNGKRASATLNRSGQDQIDEAVDSLWLSAEASVPDDANDISEQQRPQNFSDGPLIPDRDKMYERLEEFLAYSAERYPSVILGVASVSHVRGHRFQANSNGARFETESGFYLASAHFNAKEGQEVASMNGSGALSVDLAEPIAEMGSFDRLLKGSVEQVHTAGVGKKFVGDLVITPDCAGAFFGFLVEHLSRAHMVAGTSMYRDKLGEQVASEELTLRSLPCSKPGGSRVTEDCYPAADLTIVDRGILRSYLLDLYAARKTGLERSANTGSCFSIDAGNDSLEDLIGSVERGVLIGRFSGGRPSANGDFSGVAKNSYYIEDGVVQHPLSETMVSGNMPAVLRNISAVTSARADYGNSAFPWMRTSGVTVS